MNNIDIVAEFCDIAPGRTKDRPEFQRMLTEIRKGNIDVIVCWKGDRLARSVSPASALLDALEGTKTQLEAVKESLDKNFFVLLAWFGNIELDNLRDRVIMGKRGRAKAGMIPSRRICFGYDVDEAGYPVLNEKAAEVVRNIYRLYVEEGLGMKPIADRLNKEKILSPTGRQWSYSMVNTIISHRAYKGIWYYGKHRWEHLNSGVKKSQQPEEEWIGIQVPTIIDENTWQQAQILQNKRRTNAKRNTRVFYLLQHLMHCEPCGRMIGCRTERRRSSGKESEDKSVELETPLRYYFCYGMQDDGYKCRKKKFLPAEAVENVVWSATRRIVENPQAFLSGIEPQDIDNEERDSLKKEIKRVEGVLDEESNAKKFLIRRSALGKLPEADLDEQLVIIKQRVDRYSEILSELREQMDMKSLQKEHTERIASYLSAIGHVFDDLNEEQRRELIENLYTRITIDSQNQLSLTVGLPGDTFTAIDTKAS